MVDVLGHGLIAHAAPPIPSRVSASWKRKDKTSSLGVCLLAPARVRVERSERRLDQVLELAVGRRCLDQPLGLELDGQPKRVAAAATAALALRVCWMENLDVCALSAAA